MNDISVSSINQLFARASTASNAEIETFVLFCLDRVKHLIDDEFALHALEQLKSQGRVSPELAEQANRASYSLSNDNFNPIRAVAHAVCHSALPTSMYFSADRLENARLTALYCQWAISRSECPPDPDDQNCSDEDAETESDGGFLWLRRQIENREQTAQLAYVWEVFRHWFGGASFSPLEPIEEP